jgi:protein-S-isoprenylcysteine O-methyltransferase Ste14
VQTSVPGRIVEFLPVAVVIWMIAGATRIFSRTHGGVPGPRGFGVGLSIWGPLVAGQLGIRPPAWVTAVGVAGLAAALALFQWAAHSIRGRVFSLAGHDDTPQFVHTSGPYAYVRNPFYASYLLAGLSTTIMRPSVWGVLVMVLSIGYYEWLARFEEGKFERSPVAAEYAAYKARTGRLWPRLWRTVVGRR